MSGKAQEVWTDCGTAWLPPCGGFVGKQLLAQAGEGRKAVAVRGAPGVVSWKPEKVRSGQ